MLKSSFIKKLIFAVGLFSLVFIFSSGTAFAIDSSSFELNRDSGYRLSEKTDLLSPKDFYSRKITGDYINQYGIGDGRVNVIYQHTPGTDYSQDRLIGVIIAGESSSVGGVPFTQPDKAYLLKPGITVTKSDSANLQQAIDSIGGVGTYKSILANDVRANAITTAQNKIDQLQQDINNGKYKTPEELAAAKAELENLKKLQSSVKGKQGADINRTANEATDSEAIYCLDFRLNSGRPAVNLPGCAAGLGQILLQISAWVLWLAAQFFEFSLSYGLNFKDLLDKTKLVEIGWKIFRDIANITFIFVLLFISINMIIGSNAFGAKSLLAKVLITAVLINFSLFITKAVVDVSNIMALQFYGKMSGDGGGTIGDGKGLGTGIAAQFMEGLNLETVYNAGNSQNADVVGGKNLSAWTLMIIGFAGSVLILVTAFVFAAGALLFVFRTGILMILMILSPLAFVAGALPNLGGYSSMWWKKLFNQAFFAPIYMAIIYVVLAVVGGDYSSGQFGVSGTGANPQNFADLFTGNGTTVTLLFQFTMLIFFMCSALVIASQLGAYGAKTAISTGKSIRDWGYNKTAGAVARGTVGSLSYRVANSGMARAYAGTAVGKLFGGGAILRGADKISKTGFGLKSQSFADRKKDLLDRDNATVKLIEGRTVRRGWAESDKDYSDRKKKIEANDKTRADKFLGIREKADGTGKETYGFLGVSRASRDARQAAIGGRLKVKKTAAVVAKDSLTSLLGEEAYDNEKGWNHEKINPAGNSHLAKLQREINTVKEDFLTTPDAQKDEKDLLKLKLESLQERQNKMLDRIETLIEKQKVEEADIVGAIKDSNKK